MVKRLPQMPGTAAILLLAGIGLFSGCVERRYTIRTDPPGATVVVNGEEIGPAPASKSFVYYGDRQISLILDGYQTQTVIQPINAPWWDNLFTEFFTENFLPYSLRDEREFKYQMVPAQSPPAGELRDRAESLRSKRRSCPNRGAVESWAGWDSEPPRRRKLVSITSHLAKECYEITRRSIGHDEWRLEQRNASPMDSTDPSSRS